MKTLKIHVTKEDIEKGKQQHCPINRALRRLGFRRVYVSCRQCKLRSEWIDLPANAIRFINKFDNGKPVSPFTFTLKVP